MSKRVLRKCANNYGLKCNDPKCISLGHKSYWITKEKDE